MPEKKTTSHTVQAEFTALYRNTVVITLIWILFIVCTVLWTISHEYNHTIEMATNEARATFNKDLALRFWATSHGGVYVTPSDRTPPNPYLRNMQDRDVQTTSGKALTLMNPAYILRQAMEDYESLYGIKGSLASLKALNPKNAPDDWQHKALIAFDSGTKEVSEIIEVNGKEHLRLMRPLVTKEGCLKCHTHQGYQVGDIQGGFSVSVPMEPYFAVLQEQIGTYILINGFVLLIGLLSIGFVSYRTKQRIIERRQAEQTIKQMNLELEQLVKERTSELVETNEIKELFHSLVLNIPGIVYRCACDDGWTMQLMSDAVEEIAGYPASDFIDNRVRTYESIIHQDDTHIVRKTALGAVERKEPFEIEYRIVKSDGEIRWVYEKGRAAFDDKGRVLWLDGAIFDITERKNVEAELQAHRENLEKLVDDRTVELKKSEDALRIRNQISNIFLTTPDKEIYGEVLQVVLKALESPYGTFAYIDENGDRVVPSMTRDIWDECKMSNKSLFFPRKEWRDSLLWVRCILEKKTLTSSGPFRIPEGHLGLSRAVATPIIHRGEVIGNLMVGDKATDYDENDIKNIEAIADYTAPILYARLQQERGEAKRKQAVESLKQNQFYLAKAQELGHIGTWELDLLQNRLVWTDENCRIFGVPVGTVVNYEIFLEIVHPDDRQYVDREWKAALQRKPYEIEHRIVVDGTVKWVREKADVEFDTDGKPVNAIGFTQDVTERKQLEERLMQSQKMESIGTLAGGVAHEFNNILGGITGYTEIAIDDVAEGGPVAESLEQILKLGNRAREVVKEILSFSRKGKKELKPLQPHLVIEESLKLLRATIPTTIEIKHNLDETSGTILADPTQLNQICTNLCMNAAHAMEGGGGVLEIGLTPVVMDSEDVKPYPDLHIGRYVKLTVSDTGTGIEPENIEKVFDPFFTTKGVGKGTGMGLSVVHGIIKDHGGEIAVSSKLGKGTTFTVFLPNIDDEIEEKKEEEHLPIGTENILLVDDEECLVFPQKKIIERLGYSVTALTNSLETLELFKKDPQRYDLIITDLTMPHLTGDRLAAEVMAIRPDIPVIIATGYSDAVDRDKVKQSGIRAFIPKPCKRQELAKTIRLILDEE